MEIGLLFGSIIFLLVGFVLFWRQLEALLYFKKVRGKVVALEKRGTPARGSKKEGGPMYYPVIEYIAWGNQKTFTGSMGTSSPMYQIGDEVDVLYSRKKDEARLKSYIPLVMGLIFSGAGALMFFWFISIFTFSLFSIGIAAVVGIYLIVHMRRALKKRDISSLDELKESFRNTDMKTRRGTDPEQKELITTKDELQQDLSRNSKKLKYVGPIFTVVGAGVLALGIYLGMERADFLETALEASGEVIRLKEKRSDDSYVYYPVVRYKLPGTDRQLIFEHDSGSNPPSYQVGENVRVLYDPQDPNQAIIDAGIFNWMGPGIATLLGGIFALVGISSTRYYFKNRSPK